MVRKSIVKGREIPTLAETTESPSANIAGEPETKTEKSENNDNSSIASENGVDEKSSEKRQRRKSKKLTNDAPTEAPTSSTRKVRLKRKTSEKVLPVETIEDDDEDPDGGDDDDAEDGSPVDKRKRKKRRKLLFSQSKSVNRAKRNAKDGVEENEATSEGEKRTTTSPSPGVVEDVKLTLVLVHPTKEMLATYTPLQMLLDHVIRIFIKVDPEEYFTYPVDDDDAPGYSETVTNPMNMFAMRMKIDHNSYTSVAEFRTDALLIVANAKLYNESATVHHIAANKFATIVEQTLSVSSLQYFANTQPYMANITKGQLNGVDVNVGQYKTPAILEKERAMIASVRTNKQCLIDNMTNGDVVKGSVKHSDKLMQSAPKSENMLAYLAARPDGTTTLNVLTSSHIVAQSQAAKQKCARVYDLLPRLKQGNPGLLLNSTKSDPAVPVTALDYGAFASFAPTYSLDSSTLTLDDQRLLNSVYGSLANAQYAQGLASFVEDIPGISEHVDGLLDALTNGEHAKLNGVKTEKKVKNQDIIAVPKVDFESLKSLASLGIDVGFLEKLKDEMAAEVKVVAEDTKLPMAAARRLAENALALGDLCAVQTKRLSQAPPFTVTHRDTQQPSKEETNLARTIQTSLSSMMSENGAWVNGNDQLDAQIERMMHGGGVAKTQ